MSYQSGKMGMAEAIALVFMLDYPRMFLTLPVKFLEDSAGLGWLEVLIAGMPGMVMFFALLYVFKHVPGDLYSVAGTLLGKVGGWLVGGYYALLFMANYVLILRQFAENTLLTALPGAEFTIVIAAYAIVVALVTALGIEAICRGTYTILPFAILAKLIVLLILVVPFYNLYYLAPWQGTGLGEVVPKGLLLGGAGYSIFALAILRPAFQTVRTLKIAALFGLGGSILLRCLSIIVYTAVMGVAVGREKVLPFFELARLVYLGRYVQRMEALFIELWVLNAVLTLAMSLYVALYLVCRMTGLPALRPLIPIFTMILSGVAMLPPDVTSVIKLDFLFLTTFFNIGVYVIPAVLVIATSIHRKKRGTGTCAAG